MGPQAVTQYDFWVGHVGLRASRQPNLRLLTDYPEVPTNKRMIFNRDHFGLYRPNPTPDTLKDKSTGSAAQHAYGFPKVVPPVIVHVISKTSFGVSAQITAVRVMSKNIVICCDGTGNSISENISNVLKLYRVLRKTSKVGRPQIVFYDPGVGTLARPNPWTKRLQDAVTVLGLATGYGLDDNVLRAYEFLIDNYEEGDDIYLFGFSRGAYTVRVLAGLVHMTGVLARYQKNLAGAALTAYKQTSKDIENQTPQPIINQTSAGADDEEASAVPTSREDSARQFARIVSSRLPTIKFIGVWDTVASVIVPRPDRFYTFSLETLPYTRENPSVEIFRHAMAIDERRRMFRLYEWKDQQPFKRNRFIKEPAKQCVKQVWFSGVHSDIGSGYPEEESGLSQYPLLWMIDEATKAGLTVDQATVNRLAWGVPRRASPFTYAQPDAMCAPHDSMTPLWRILEWFPKKNKYKQWERKSLLGRYIPDSEPRPIPEKALIHRSVIQRMERGMKKGWLKKGMEKDPEMEQVTGYRPINLPREYEIVENTPEPKPVRDWKEGRDRVASKGTMESPTP